MSLIIPTWTRIMGSEAFLKYVDGEAVEEFQLRAPGMSQVDDEHVTSAVKSSKVLKNITDEAERERILRRARQITYLIPSVYTLQLDFKYLRQCNTVVKKLLVGEGLVQWTVEDSAYAAFSAEAHNGHNTLRNFQRNFRLLNLYVMRHLVELSGENPLLEDREKKQSPRTYDATAWYRLAKEARQLGFNSEEVSRILSTNPNAEEARSVLLNVRRPPTFEYDPSNFDTLISNTAKAFHEARRQAPKKHKAELTCSVKGEPLSRRCGRQYSDAYARDREFLTDEYFTCEMQKNVDITSLFVRRSVFHAFWGEHSMDGQLELDRVVRPVDSAMPDAEPIHSGTSEVSEIDEEMGDAPALVRRTRSEMDQSRRKLQKQQRRHALAPQGGHQQALAVISERAPFPMNTAQDEASPGTSSQALTTSLADNTRNLGDQSGMQIFLQVNGTWKLEKRCRRGSVQSHVQEVLTEAGHGHSLFLFQNNGRGLRLDDCPDVRDGIIGIGPDVAARFPIQEEEL